MNIEELKNKPKRKSPTLSRKKIAELNKNTGKEVSEIRFTAREK
ncbi:addiction module toxin, GnsA/GnsB family [Escherichia coli]|nr:addiction module toxin, GnsA/GnsB family [Escherichia coli]